MNTRCLGQLLVSTLSIAAVGVVRAQDNPISRPSHTAVNGIVDLAVYGAILRESGAAGVEWSNPRDIDTIEVFPRPLNAKLPDALHVEWWGSVWPDNGTGGWMKLDDHWNGQWVRVSARPTRDATTHGYRFRFPPLSKSEWKRSLDDAKYPKGKPPAYRRTLKVRVVADAEGPLGDVELRAYGQSSYREGWFDVEVRASQAGPSAGRISVTNGHLVEQDGVAALPSSVSTVIKRIGMSPAGFSPEPPSFGWEGTALAGQSARMRLHLIYSHSEDRNSNDLTRVTVRLGEGDDAPGFSFIPEDVLKAGVMRIPALGALVTPADSHITMASDPGIGDKFWRQTVRQRVAEMPEMSREQAMANIPRLQPARWVPLGVPCARQEICVGPAGDWMFDPGSLWTEARDSQRMKLRGKGSLYAMLDTQQEPRFKGDKRENLKRYLEAGHLPLIHAEWDQDGVHYHHALAATILLGDISEDDKRRGDETVGLLTKLEISNPGPAPATARLSIRFSDPAPIALTPEGVIEIRPADRSVIPANLSAIRGIISMGRPVGGGAEAWKLIPGKDAKVSSVLSWSAVLPAGGKQLIYLKAAYVDLLDAAEFAAIKALDFEERIPHDLQYWKDRLARDMQLDVPEPELVNFYKANLWHNIITCDRDPQTGLYNEGVGTFAYKVFANETVMIARSMDMRGEHAEAERYLEPMLHFQGQEGLTGRFTTREGVFHSAGAYTHGQYAMNHGFVLWGVADHYFYTRDRKYLERVASQLIKGCDFLINQRKATTTAPSYDAGPVGKQSPTCGLAPASSLEDVIEFKYWFPTNAYFCLGMKRVAQALTDIKHPDADRIAREAENYRHDIQRAVREAVTQSALLPLRNGTYVPLIPSRVHQWRNLTEGWIREALYCGVDLTVAEILRPDDPLVTWALDNLEDNTFYSAESGYDVKDVEKNWFAQGAVTLQPCLVDLPRLYMNRDENAASLRAFWNAYALLIYPDTQSFAEWAKAFGRGGGPVYKTADESRFCIWFRQFLVNEEGNTLWLARGTPRSWLTDGQSIRVDKASTHFGDVAFTIRSEVKQGRIAATVQLPTRTLPVEVWLRLRHPSGQRPVRVRLAGQILPQDRLVGDDIRLRPGIDPTGTPIELVAEYAAGAGPLGNP